MQITRNLAILCARALKESMDMRDMCHLAKRLIPDYDIYKQSGFPESFAIPSIDAAKQIVSDIVDSNLFFQLIQILIHMNQEGFMGRKIPISYLNDILKYIYSSGYIFDSENQIFVENPRIQKTRNWGALQEGESYALAFLAIDIIGNTKIVQKYSKEIVETTYTELNFIVQNAIDKRNGRFWMWEGDGGVISFFFGNKNLDATLAAVEIMNNVFLYNRTICKLTEPLRIRISVHSGVCEYTERNDYLKKLEVMKIIAEMEKTHSTAHSICISYPVRMMLDGFIADQFVPLGSSNTSKYYRYELEWEK
ncbi:MAG: adenylate/guanylate cyclase domain-containing protein [Spirochaetales bacterium]|nr:adenylate/guanylate cyclase domain-containing protein [Spirochaetales bacterium]